VAERIQPIVLVGGRSRRFGRDKLREHLPDGAYLVDRPIRALRAVFGPHVALVGECHADISSRGDLVIDDGYPGVGPIGGILSALEAGDAGVLVLSGDLPAITAQAVQEILRGAEQFPDAWAVLATSSGAGSTLRLEPCIGLYRQRCTPLLRQALAGGHRSLHDLVPREHLATVEIAAAATANINTPGAMARWTGDATE
jgi:molybdenum cofactor guanylyltransferase